MHGLVFSTGHTQYRAYILEASAILTPHIYIFQTCTGGSAVERLSLYKISLENLNGLTSYKKIQPGQIHAACLHTLQDNIVDVNTCNSYTFP